MDYRREYFALLALCMSFFFGDEDDVQALRKYVDLVVKNSFEWKRHPGVIKANERL